METKEITKEKEMMHLADCMASIISQLKEEKKSLKDTTKH